MKRLQKEKLVKELAVAFNGAKSFVVAHNNGIVAFQSEALRRSLKEKKSRMMVVKNKLISIAAKDTAFAEITKNLKGNKAVFWGEEGLELAKILKNFAYKAENAGKLEIVGGFFEGRVFDKQGVEMLGNLPDMDTSRAVMLGCLQAVASRFLYLLQKKSKVSFLLGEKNEKFRKVGRRALKLEYC